jgi:hypothetical protein
LLFALIGLAVSVLQLVRMLLSPLFFRERNREKKYR